MTSSPHTIESAQALTLARQRMRAYSVRHLPVVHDGELVGTLSDRDVARIVALPGIEVAALTVGDVMSPDPYAVAPETPLAEVVGEMAAHHYGSAVVVDGGKILGIFTVSDALSAFADTLDAGA
ncbi:MAG: CBS domain-containing protein [Myxococcales bacterium]|nr:CBS domain-containing protein [Myxococcales bacterium]